VQTPRILSYSPDMAPGRPTSQRGINAGPETPRCHEATDHWVAGCGRTVWSSGGASRTGDQSGTEGTRHRARCPGARPGRVDVTTQRWDSCRLNTPGYTNRMLGAVEPDSFSTGTEVVTLLDNLARELPIRKHASVQMLDRRNDDYVLRTSDGEYVARSVVIATGNQNVPAHAGDWSGRTEARAAYGAPASRATTPGYVCPSWIRKVSRRTWTGTTTDPVWSASGDRGPVRISP
jgi:hypothetical protein